MKEKLLHPVVGHEDIREPIVIVVGEGNAQPTSFLCSNA
jgi:hypothetical protein